MRLRASQKFRFSLRMLGVSKRSKVVTTGVTGRRLGDLANAITLLFQFPPFFLLRVVSYILPCVTGM